MYGCKRRDLRATRTLVGVPLGRHAPTLANQSGSDSRRYAILHSRFRAH